MLRWTPLIIASSAGHEAVVRLLIGAGADVDACTDQGRSSLLYACSRNRKSIAQLLIQVNITSRYTLCTYNEHYLRQMDFKIKKVGKKGFN